MPGIAKLFKRYINFRRVVSLYRRRISRQVFEQCKGIVQHGPFKGMQWLDNPAWGRGEQGAMVLGLYEQEVLEQLANAPERYRTFVDVGAADGYYAVGLLHSGKADRSIAYEIVPAAQQAIKRLAAANHVAHKITVLGAANDPFVNDLKAQQIHPETTMFLIDIEGAEFKLLTGELFAYLKDSLIVVETHAHIYPDPAGEMQRLKQRASATHRVSAWTPGARNPWVFDELKQYSELDRWILCSEGRFEVQTWLRFDPL